MVAFQVLLPHLKSHLVYQQRFWSLLAHFIPTGEGWLVITSPQVLHYNFLVSLTSAYRCVNSTNE